MITDLIPNGAEVTAARAALQLRIDDAQLTADLIRHLRVIFKGLDTLVESGNVWKARAEMAEMELEAGEIRKDELLAEVTYTENRAYGAEKRLAKIRDYLDEDKGCWAHDIYDILNEGGAA